MLGSAKYPDAEAEQMKPPVHQAQRLMDMMDGEGTNQRPLSRALSSTPPPAFETSEPFRRDLSAERRRSHGEERAASVEGCAILSVTPAGEGETVAVVLSVPPSEADMDALESDGRPGSRSKRVKLHLLVEQYADLQAEGCTFHVGEITEQWAEELIEAGKLCAAIKRGMWLLQYGDRSARRLTAQLTAKGTDRETAATATAYLVRKGYIREDDTARLRAEQSLRKGWGPRRIREDLRARGFTSEAVEEAMETLSKVDFSEKCADIIRKKYREIPEDRADLRKMTASLMRLGYDSDHIREAMRSCLREPRD